MAYFNATELTKITAQSVRDFMAKRKASGISNRTINRERDFLRGVLKMAKRWQLIADEVEVKSGLKPEEQIVVAGQQNVHEGSLVRIAGGGQ